MNEIVKHINDTNASYRNTHAGDAKNTDLFLDNEHYEMFKDVGEQVTVRFSKENLSQAILFIASILPRKYDNSAVHKVVYYSARFIREQLNMLDGFFMEAGNPVNFKIQKWNARKDVPKKNGEIDNRFYFNGLLEEYSYFDIEGKLQRTKFTIRNYLAGGYSSIHIKKSNDNIFDITVVNTTEAYYDDNDNENNLDVLETTQTLSNLPLQQIFYGAPGTGKSCGIKRVLAGNNIPNENIFRTTFHPDSDYSTFVGAYKPTMEVVPRYESSTGTQVEEKRIAYNFIPQAFLNAYVRAYQTDENVYLIIEEINRGNCAQIFGDLFQLLDRGDDGKSDYSIKADTDIRTYLETALGSESEGIKNGELCLPSNLYILATMNTSDQSLFPIDSAFKRRWDWSYMPISDAKKGYVIDVAGSRYDWWQFLEKINEKIESTTNSEDKKLGYFFCKAKDGIINSETFVGKVVFYLWNDVFKDYEFGDAIFVDTVDDGKLSFAKFYTEGEMKTKVRAEKVAQFLGNLGLTPLEESEEEYNGQVESTDTSENLRATWSVTERKRYDFWQAFLAYAQKNDEFKTYFGGTKKAGKDHWKNFYVSGADFYMSVVLKLWERAIALQVYFDRTTDTYYHLATQKKEIEAEMETTYEWRENPEKKSSTIIERVDNIDFEDKEHWTTIFDLIITRTLRMREVFVKYSKQ